MQTWTLTTHYNFKKWVTWFFFFFSFCRKSHGGAVALTWHSETMAGEINEGTVRCTSSLSSSLRPACVAFTVFLYWLQGHVHSVREGTFSCSIEDARCSSQWELLGTRRSEWSCCISGETTGGLTCSCLTSVVLFFWGKSNVEKHLWEYVQIWRTKFMGFCYFLFFYYATWNLSAGLYGDLTVRLFGNKNTDVFTENCGDKLQIECQISKYINNLDIKSETFSAVVSALGGNICLGFISGLPYEEIM